MLKQFINTLAHEMRTSLLLIVAALCSQGSAQAHDTKINKGKPVPQDDWPATYIFKSEDEAPCTATMIGKRVLVTAAHCIDQLNKGLIGKTIDEDQNIDAGIEAICEVHPSFNDDKHLDYALCALSENAAAGTKYENLHTDHSQLEIGGLMSLVGYGCNARPASSGHAEDGQEKVDFDKIKLDIDGFGGLDIERLFIGGILLSGSAYIKNLPTFESPYLISSGESTTCHGDSGGAAFTDIHGVRKIIGVSSKSSLNRESYFASTANRDFLIWANNWLTNHDGLTICGISTEQEGCRRANPTPSDLETR